MANPCHKRQRQIILLLVMLCLFAGCGRKAPPQPPRQTAPPIVKDLRKVIDGSRLHLSWSLPGLDGQAGRGVAGFGVYRARKKLSDDDCPKCPVLFERVAKIPVYQLTPDADGGKSVTYAMTLEKGYRYLFKVTILMVGGATGRDSNQVEFVY